MLIKFAALDLGSNSFLCLIGEGNVYGISKILSDEMELVRLGEGLSENKYFSSEALKRADETLGRFKTKINQFHVEKVFAVATAAARDAENKNELFEICNKHRIPIQIIQGAREAEITYAGAQCFVLELEDQPSDFLGQHLVVDVGGRSTEIIFGVDEVVKSAWSYDLGVVALTEKFLMPRVTQSQIASAQDYIRAQMSKRRLDIQHPFKMKAVAGTPTTLAEILCGAYNPVEIEKSFITQGQLEKWQEEFSRLSPQEIVIKYKIPMKRADVLLAGVLILCEVMKYFKCEQLKVSTKGVRFGVALQILQA